MIEKPPISKVVLFGFIVIVIFFGSFTLWSILAPLDSAAIAPGKITVDTNRKSIQHLEGGIVKHMHVREGSKVKAGDPLITLDDTQTKAQLTILKTQLNNLLATEARLIAERDKTDKIEWPERLLKEKNDPKIQKLMKSQENILKANRRTLLGQLDILKKRVLQHEKQVEALHAQVESSSMQSKLIEEEKQAVEYLEKRKIVPKPQLLALKREAARLLGNKGENLGLIAKAHHEIGEAEQQIITIQDDYLKKILERLDEVQTKIADIWQREAAASDVLKRTKIIAPKDGTVVGLQIHTIGGVITPGSQLMDIVPSQDKLVVEVEVNPLDIDMVHPGLLAKVKLTAFKQRNSPFLIGKVERVSPDIFTDESSGRSYFIARVIINKAQLAKYPHLVLYPGMPVNVMIVTDKRSAFRYFLQPLKDSFDNAFKEQ